MVTWSNSNNLEKGRIIRSHDSMRMMSRDAFKPRHGNVNKKKVRHVQGHYESILVHIILWSIS